MATSIEKNTKKIMAARLQAELDNLFEEQQLLNNNSNGTYGQYGLEVGEPIYNSEYHPYMLPNVNVFNGIPNSVNNPYSLDNVDVTDNKVIRNNMSNPYMLGDVNITGYNTNRSDFMYGPESTKAITQPVRRGILNNQRVPVSLSNVNITDNKPFRFYENTPRNTTYNSLLNPYNPSINNTGGYSGPPPGFPEEPNVSFQDPTNVVAASQVAPTGGKTATGNVIPTSTGNRVPIMDKYLKYVPPVDNWQPTIPTTVEEPSKIKFSKSYDDPNSADYNPAKSKSEALKVGPFDKKLDWSKAGTFALQAAPAIYNMIRGLQRPDKVTPKYNPYENEIRSAMRNRRFNIDPILNANKVAQAVANRNIRNVAGSRGELMGNLTSAQNARMVGDAAAFAQKNNIDNQYLSEQAQMDANLGQNRAQMDWMTQDYNLQNKEATRRFIGQGLNDISNLSQTRQLMNNQLLSDQQRIGVMKDVLGVYKYMPGLQAIEEFINSKNNGQ